jgi:hypothetical protein
VCDLLDDDCITFKIEQYSVVAHAQSIAEIGFAQPFYVADQSAF